MGTSSYTKVVKALDKLKGGGDDGYQPCRECRSPTLRAILAQHGGMCIRCYEAWCTAGQCGSGDSVRLLTHGDKLGIVQRLQGVTRGLVAGKGDMRRWARDLQRREQAGEQLSRAQRAAWRNALHNEPGVGDPSEDAAGKLRTAELQAAAARQVNAYIGAHPDAASVGWTQEKRDAHQRRLDMAEHERRKRATQRLVDNYVPGL